MSLRVSNGEGFDISGLHGDAAEVAIRIVAQDGIMGGAVVALPVEADLQTEVVLQVAGVVLLEVLLVVLHLVAVDDPDLVLETLSPDEPVELLLDDLRGVLEEELLQVVAVLDEGVRLQLLDLVEPVQEGVHEFEFGRVFTRSLLLVLHLPAQLDVVPESLNSGLLAPGEVVRDACVPIGLFLLLLLVDGELRNGGEVQFGTGELGVIALAVVAGQHFELVQDGLVAVPQEAVVQVVHLRLLQRAYQVLELHEVDHRVLRRLHLVVRTLPRQELQSQQERPLPLLYLHAVDHHVVEVAAPLPGHVPYFALPQDQQVELVVQPPQGLFGVADMHFYLFGEAVESAVDQVAEEGEVVEDGAVALLEVLLLEVGGQAADEGVLLLDVELLADVDALLDVVVDLPLELVRQGVLVAQLLEGLQVLALLDVLAADVADERAHPVDVVGQTHHAHDLDEDEADGLLVGTGHDVSEADRQHDVAPPVVGPHVLLEPQGVGDSARQVPVVAADVGHPRQEDRQDVCEAEVEQKHLYQRPVLLIVVVLYEKYLQFLYLLQALRQLSDYEQSDVLHESEIGIGVDYEDQHAQHINDQATLQIVFENLTEGCQSLSCI